MMNTDFLPRGFLGTLLFSMTTVIVGCGASGTDPDDDTTSSGGGSTTTSAATSGVGGDGTGGAGGDTGLCPGGCGDVTPPDCFVAVCNDGTYQGAVGQCVVVPEVDGNSCDDGMFCTTDDTCQAGVCTGGPANDCGMDSPECQEITCDESAKSCSTAPLDNGTVCVSDDLCQTGTTCSNGQCTGGTPKDCFFSPTPSECFVSVCNPQNGMCEPEPGNDGGSCTDANDLCTVQKTCTAGQCVGGVPKDCSNLTQGCDLGVCDAVTGVCATQTVGDGMACDDLDACTTGETCSVGTCGSGTPVTNCTAAADGCCPSNCDETNDFDCAFSCELYAISSSRILYQLDKATGAATQTVTAGSAAGITGELAQDPVTKTVYLSSTGNDALFTLDVDTGAVTLVGPYGNSSIVMHGMEWDSSTNTLYGLSDDDFYEIDTTTGTATLIGSTGLSGFGNIGYDSTNDVMYLISGGNDSLYTVNRATAQVTLIGPLNGPTNPHSLAYDPSTDTLYLVDPGTDVLSTVNRSTGAITAVGSFGTVNLLGLMCYSE